MRRNWFRDLTVGQKLLASFGVLLLVLGLSVGAVLFYLARINSYVERHHRITVPALTTAADIRRSAYDLSFALHTVLEKRSSEEKLEIFRRVGTFEARMAHALSVYRAQHAVKTHPVLFRMLADHGRDDLADEEERAIHQIEALQKDLDLRWRRMASHVERKQEREARRQLAEMDTLLDHLIEAVTALVSLQAKVTSEMKAEGDSLLRQARAVILVLILLLGGLIVTSYLAASRQIARPLRHLASVADQVARDDLSANFVPWPARDEVGELARSLESMLSHIQERTRALERKTRELESFTYSVAHDLKSPLREIEGFSSLLEADSRPSLSPTAQQYLSRIRASVLRMAALINDLLRYSRLEQQALPKSQVDLRALVEAVVAERTASLTNHPPRISIELSALEVSGEPSSIRQALTNLLDNAIKFSRGGAQPEITVGGTANVENTVLWVRDNGIGFEQKDAERIFGLFEQLHGPAEYEGTGVGLAIVKLVMEKHGGRAWAESSPGKGSAFFLEFPHGRSPHANPGY